MFLHEKIRLYFKIEKGSHCNSKLVVTQNLNAALVKLKCYR